MIPSYMKYAKSASQSWLDQAVKLKPSDLSKPSLDVNPDDYPLITKFNNIADCSNHTHSIVEIDMPLFQPAPKIVIFENYQPFAVVKKRIFFRNKDSVGRRIKLIKPDTPFFEISAPQTISGESLQQSKIAAGMEVSFVVTFKPQEVRDYGWDLECVTERECFTVPLRAIGMRPLLTLPDEIDFGPCSIKSPSEKKIVVRNIGSSVAKFKCNSLCKYFICPEQDISIEANSSIGLEFSFVPNDASLISDEIEVTFSNGIKCFIAVKGCGKNVEISLTSPSVVMEPSYISLCTQKTLRIRNLSDAPVKFRWKSFSTEEEEDLERNRLLDEINRIECAELLELQRQNQGSVDCLSNDKLMMFNCKAEETILRRKYENLRRALCIDKMMFVDDIFDISPMEGEVWAHSDIEVTVCFNPDTAAQYNCLAFLDVSGRSDRLPLQLVGIGIGPQATLSFEILDIGDIFINDVNCYKLFIKNKGDIPAQWNFVPSSTRFGSKFSLEPVEGFLLPNQSTEINIRFECDILGEFSENFRFALQGNDDMLVCQLKGHVIGPTFHFDCKTIDFGTVSYDYLHATTVKLVNTSKVPMVFSLSIPQDGTYLKKEFNIEPNCGTLYPQEATEILIEFIPTTVQIYDYSLSIDILGVGENILSIPIHAECIVSTVKLDLPSREVEFGDCFIRYPYEVDLNILNLSGVVFTKFEILPQPKHTLSIASYEVIPSVAVIEPSNTIVVKVRLIGQKLGAYKIPLAVTIAGSQEPPLQAVLSFNVVGPKIVVENSELKWGNIECLKDHVRSITISNTGLIDASMKIFLKMARSCYRIDTKELTLEAQQSFDLKVVANLDDSVVTKDELHIMVNEGDNLMVPLLAKGVGTTVHCAQSMEILDFGIQLSSVPFERQIVLENKGRRPQQLRWTNKTIKVENASRLMKAKKLGKDTSIPGRLPKHLAPLDPSFAVFPAEITLRPRTATTFTFKGICMNPRLLSEQFTLESKVGKERNMKVIMETEVKCEVVNPLLQVSTNEISFQYLWEKNVDPQTQKSELTFTNNSSLALTFVLKTEIPFNLSSYEQTLNPGQSCCVCVDFDPMYKDDRISHIVEKNLQISYRGHPQKDFVKLIGEVVFPNLKFDLTTINFGCVLNDTSKTLKLKATNCSKVNVSFEWSFLEQAPTKGKSRSTVFSTPPSHIFDILPVKSMILPDDSENIEFTMLGMNNGKLSSGVICKVEGGPEYKFQLFGESSNVAFELNRDSINFGRVLFIDYGDAELTICNRGKVCFNFSLLPKSEKDCEHLEFFPDNGKINASQEFKITVRFHPGFPKLVHTSFLVNVGHFDPVEVFCSGEGVFQTALVALPRCRKLGPFSEIDDAAVQSLEELYSTALKCLSDRVDYISPRDPSTTTQETSLCAPFYDEPSFAVFGDENNESSSQFTSEVGLHNAKGLFPTNIDLEMQRIVLCRRIEECLNQLKAPDCANSRLIASALQTFVDIKSIIVARYNCEFGNVIIGQSRKKVFKITNISGVGAISWIFDKKYLAASGFSIEPEKVMKLGESESIDVTVKFFARNQLKVGQKLCVIPMEILGCGTIHIHLIANVCLPEVNLSVNEIDFAKVVLGTSVKTFVRLHNPSPVAANWVIKPNSGKEEPKFFVEPMQGFLKPNKNCTISVEYIPTAINSKNIGNYMLKVDQNKKLKQLRLIGEGIIIPLSFDPPMIEFLPILPGSMVGEQLVNVTNLSNLPAEVYSLDFDAQYKEEEKILTSNDKFDKHGNFRCAKRCAGEKLPAEVLNAYNDINVAATENDPLNHPAVSLITAPVRNVVASRDEGLHQDIIIYGPPLSGTSTLAMNLGKKLLLPVRKFDDLLIEVADVDHPTGLLARKLANRLSEIENKRLQQEESNLLTAAEQSKVDAVESYKKEKKGKIKEIPDEIYKTEAVDCYEKFVRDFDKSSSNIAKIIEFRCGWKDLGDGLILDNLDSSYVELDILIESLKLALGKFVAVNITVDGQLEGYLNWIKHVYEWNKQKFGTLQKSIESNTKTLIKLLKSANEKAIDSVIAKINEHPVADELRCIGNEVWIDSYSGKVTELDVNDFKSLDDKDKIQYLQHLIIHHNEESIFIKHALDRSLSLLGGDHVFSQTYDELMASGAESQTWISTFNEYHEKVSVTLKSLEDECNSNVPYCCISLVGNETADTVLQNTLAILPPGKVSVQERENRLPPNESYQIYRKPIVRPNRKSINNFKIVTGENDTNSSRWVIPPQGQVVLKLLFQSEKEGLFETSLDFEVMGTGQKISVPCKAICEYPKVNLDTKTLFMRRAKVVNQNNPYPSRRYVISDNFYSFGSLALFKKPEWRKYLPDTSTQEDQEKFKSIEASNSDIIRLSNNGKYKCTVNLIIENDGSNSNSSFLLDQDKLLIEEGETKDVRIWALPTECKDYSCNLIVNVLDNPESSKFQLKCWGSEPQLEIIGPWSSAIAAATEAVAKNTDKKLVKDLETKLSALKEFLTIDFNRVLLGKNEVRKFSLVNKSLIPVAWEIIVEDFAGSKAFSVSPTSGEIPYNSSLEVEISFVSTEPIITEGKFTLKYSDIEGGLQQSSRTCVSKFKLVAEAYKITAVNFDSEGNEITGSSKLSFGTIRVGDYAILNVKMGNKGKYSIGYKCNFTTSKIGELVKIDPSEGVIDAGVTAAADLKITICSLEELVLKDNCEIVVQIFEPLTNEVVESFPLIISGQVKYNKFRIQPSKGIAFSAVRFDAAPCVKKFELRNESDFDISFVVLPASSEHEELDGLDSESLSFYAYYLPAGIRPKELGENFASRVVGGPEKRKDNKPSSKQKKDVVVEVSSKFSPFVRDPDNLMAVNCPPNPLNVGSFSVFPRIGSIPPSQSLSIDVHFDPSVCKTVKEKLRICISGTDPAGSLVNTLKAFELIGESCLPALVYDDFTNIFEEQDIVTSLFELSSECKLEKIPVGKAFYCEKERLLAFGPVSCVQVGKGMCERIKIINPTKIDIKARFRVAIIDNIDPPKDKKDGTKKDNKQKKANENIVVEVPQAFSISPLEWDIPPHEFRFVNIFFHPEEIKSYRSTFIAEIVDENENTINNGMQSQSKTLRFDVGGSGTLPFVSVIEPFTKSIDGNLVINFNKILPNKLSKKYINIRNDGVMVATCLFHLDGNNSFVFPANGTSVTLQPGEKCGFEVMFCPTKNDENANYESVLKVNILNNPFDQYMIKLIGEVYTCDASIQLLENNGDDSSCCFAFQDINLTIGKTATITPVLLSSLCDYPLKFEFLVPDTLMNLIKVCPSLGHLAQNGTKEIDVEFKTDQPVNFQDVKIICRLEKIEYRTTSNDMLVRNIEESLWGKWDNNMKSLRPALSEDLKLIEEYSNNLKEYLKNVETEKQKGKKGKPVGPPPPKISLEPAPSNSDGSPMIYEIVEEPFNVVVKEYKPQDIEVTVSGAADCMVLDCDIMNETLSFIPTFMFQSSSYTFLLNNKSKINVPIIWSWENSIEKMGRQGYFGECPFAINPQEIIMLPNTSSNFVVTFTPLDSGEFEYKLKGNHMSSCENVIMCCTFKASGKRPICHFEIKETLDYLSRRLPNLKNENGLHASIEDPNIKVVEVESVGLRTRNSFRFYVTNTSNESYEFLWESLGEPSPFWRCVQSAGMMFPGKRIEMVFEYLPEDTNAAESFYKFSVPKAGLLQNFLFAGKVLEPKVGFSSSKVDYHSVMLGGEGITETIFLENMEHLPFNFSFDKYSLMQLEGPTGTILDIKPKEGTIPPGGKAAIALYFKPQEEVLYNFNLACIVKRKPNKLNLNVKGEGYSVHPQIQLETAIDGKNALGGSIQDKYLLLKPLPFVNAADFGSVQVLDTVTKNLSLLNSGKYNFDYSWSLDHLGSMLSLSGGKLNGTLLKGDEINYKLTFAPQFEGSLGGSSLLLTVAGKYSYSLLFTGQAIKPALKFSFMKYDFGSCFISSPGGTTVIEEEKITLKNQDSVSNISVECLFQKTRALWLDFSPTVIPPGKEIIVPLFFAPREVKEYSFAVPFLINGTSKVSLIIQGHGIASRLELMNGSQRRTTFGLVNVGNMATRNIVLINKSKKSLPVQLVQTDDCNLQDRCVSFEPTETFVLQPKESFPVVVKFNPTKRIPSFSEDLMVRYAGILRPLVTLSGKAQGIEVNLDSDSIPFGSVVLNSQKTKKLTLENIGDLTVNFQWDGSTFGEHFSVSPVFGKLLPANEITFDVIFKPLGICDDIRQENMTLSISGGLSDNKKTKTEITNNLKVTCSGVCISPPPESTQKLLFHSSARRDDIKTIKISNPSDKNWFLSPSLEGVHWKIPHELKVPMKGTNELPVTYFPLTMAPSTNPHLGKLFVALPDGTANLYELAGIAEPPMCSEVVNIETSAKKSITTTLKIQNWLNVPQTFHVEVDIVSKSCPATFVTVANVTEVAPNGTKEFPVRFISFVEGNSKVMVKFTNSDTSEYCFFEINVRITESEILEVFKVESPVRQIAKCIVNIENPLPQDFTISMGTTSKPSEWWTCNSKFIKVDELTQLSGNREGCFEVSYRPLVITSQPQEYILSIFTQELGTFKYKIVTTATPSILRHYLRFEAPLGGLHSETFVFRSFHSTKTDYSCAVSKQDSCFFTQKLFMVDSISQSWDGDDVHLPINFEPTEIGEFNDILTVSSNEFGTYQCELIGICVSPLPQGPYLIEQGANSVEIMFRNCYNSSYQWSCRIDSTAFKLIQPAASESFLVNGKTEFKFVVGFDPSVEDISIAGGIGSFISAKMIVSCVSKPQSPSWTYYLKGKITGNNAIPVKGKK